MNPADRDALIDAVERTFAEEDIDLYEGAAWLKRYVDEYSPILEAALARPTLAAWFDSTGLEDPAQIRTVIAVCGAALPILRQFAANAIGKAADTLPPAPSGRPQALTSDQMRQVNEKVVSLILKGVQTGDAQTRAAHHFGIAKRTVQRAWKKREELAQEPFQSIGDLMQALGAQTPRPS